MKKLIGLAVAAFATVAAAGEYHVYSTLICSDCHTMHASRQHSFGQAALNPADTAVFAGGDTGGHEYLLLAADRNRTCLVCHDRGAGAPDVFGANQSTFALGTRSAGALNSGYAAIANETGYQPNMGHSLGATTPPPGFSAAVGYAYPNDLDCARCHSVHGRNTYRNLRDRGTDAPVRNPSYVMLPAGQANLDYSADVNVFGGGYSADDIFYTSAAGSANGANKMTAFCGMCHGNFHDDVQGGAAPDTYFKRHPTDQVTLTPAQVFTAEAVEGTNLSLKLTYIQGAGVVRGSEAGTINFAADATATATVGCLTCHKAHGNMNSFALFFPGNSVGPTGTEIHTPDANKEEGAGTTVRNLCGTCHGPGRTNANATAFR